MHGVKSQPTEGKKCEQIDVIRSIEIKCLVTFLTIRVAKTISVRGGIYRLPPIRAENPQFEGKYILFWGKVA